MEITFNFKLKLVGKPEKSKDYAEISLTVKGTCQSWDF